MAQRVKTRTRWHVGRLTAALSGAGTAVIDDGGDPDPPVGDLEADWQRRISDPGVVWYHDFRSEDEVAAFHWTQGYSGGNDPQAKGGDAAQLRRNATDGVTGACLEYVYPAGRSPTSSYWWRPFAPLSAGNGKGEADPAATGALTVRNWTPTDGGSQLANFQHGWYGHPDSDDANFDGHDFWLQVRVKMDPRRITGGNASHTVGKFVWLTTAQGAQSLSNAEHVIWSYGQGGNDGAKNYARVYALNVNGIGAFDPLDQAAPGSRIQPGSEVATDWAYSGGWDTLLIHLRPGEEDVTTGDDATHLEIFAAREGESEYTKIWDQVYGLGAFEARAGLQALILGGYNNGRTFPQEFYHRYCQVIFSRDYIPCPQSGVLPSWYPSSAGQIVEIDSGTTIKTAAQADGALSYGGTGKDEVSRPWSGGAIVYVDGKPYMVVSGGGHGDSAYNGILKFGPLYGAGSDEPEWSVFLSASPVAAVQGGPVYSDGRLAAAHTYNNLIGVGDRLYQMATDAYWQSGAASPRACYYTPAGQVDIANNVRAGGFYGACAHWQGRIFYVAGGAQWHKLVIYDVSTNRYSTEPNDDIAFDNYVSAAVDTNRGALLVIAGSPSGGATSGAYWDLTTLSRRTGINRPPNYDESIVFDPDRDAFVSVVSGSRTVYELDAAELAAGNNPEWTSRTFTGATPAASEPAGTYGRFRYIPELKGYLLAPEGDSSVYFYRSGDPWTDDPS